MEAMRRIFVILIVLILSLTASPIPVEGATSEVIITQEGRYQCYKVTFEGCPHYTLIEYIPEAGISFSSYWKSLTRGAYANNPSGVAVAIWRVGNNGDIVFDEPVAKAGFYYSSRTDVVLEAFNEQNDLVALSTGSMNAPFGFSNWDPISVSIDSNSIKWIKIHGMPNRIAIDDLKICRITCTGGVFPEDIIAHIEALDIDDGFSNSMISKLDNAIEALEKDQGGAAVNKLGALMNELEAQSGKKISEEDADALINMALLAIENIEGNIL